MSQFVLDVPKMVVKECRTAMLINDMEISCLMVNVKQIEEDKIKEILKKGK